MQHILIVEDEPQIARLLKCGLTYKGFEVTVANSGQAALENVRSTPQDLVALDVMPTCSSNSSSILWKTLSPIHGQEITCRRAENFKIFTKL